MCRYLLIVQSSQSTSMHAYIVIATVFLPSGSVLPGSSRRVVGRSVLLTVHAKAESSTRAPLTPHLLQASKRHYIGRQHVAMSSISAPSWLTSIPQGTRILSGATIVLSLLLSVARANHNRAVPGLGAVFGEAQQRQQRDQGSLHAYQLGMLTLSLSLNYPGPAPVPALLCRHSHNVALVPPSGALGASGDTTVAFPWLVLVPGSVIWNPWTLATSAFCEASLLEVGPLGRPLKRTRSRPELPHRCMHTRPGRRH